MKKAISVGLGVLGMLAAAGAMAADMGIMVMNPWVREAPPTARALAGYMVVMNHADKERTLVGASSPSFGEVMLHRTVMEEGMAKMVHQHAIAIPAGGEVTFEPNGYHIMLMQPKQAFKAGDAIEVSLQFQNGEVLTVTHEVRPGAGMAMDHSHHH